MDRVEVSPAITAFIAARIDHYETECPSKQSWLLPRVKEHRVLPLYVGWVETVGIMADGRIRKFSADGEHVEYEGLREPTTFSEFAVALGQGARHYPELAAIVPARPANAVTCRQCGGTGITPVPKVVCECGGLGWVLTNAA